MKIQTHEQYVGLKTHSVLLQPLQQKKKNVRKRIFLITTILLILGAGISAAYFLYFGKLSSSGESNELKNNVPTITPITSAPTIFQDPEAYILDNYIMATNSTIKGNTLAISLGMKVAILNEISCSEIYLNGGELLIRPDWNSQSVNVIVDRIIINSGILRIAGISRESILNITVKDKMMVQNSSRILLNQGISSQSVFYISAKNIFIDNSEFKIENIAIAKTAVNLISEGIGVNSGNFSIRAPKVNNQVTIQFNGQSDVDTNSPFTSTQQGQGFNFICAEKNSYVEMLGRNVKNPFVKINQTIRIGDEWILLNQFVENDWFLGDEIVIGATGFFNDEAESFRIAEVKGSFIRISPKAKYMHFGELQSFNSKWKSLVLDERAEVALLTRNIQLYGLRNQEINRGAQIMATSGSVLNLQYIEINQGGHQGILKRYPIHLHKLGNTPGQILRGNSVHRSGNRCITVHSTNNVLIEENVCYHIKGHAFFLENAIEIGNKFIRNLGMNIQVASLIPSDSQPAVFWITNPNNTYIENIASGSDSTCFWWLGNQTPLNEDKSISYKPKEAPFGVFKNNFAHTCRMGLRFDESVDPDSGNFNGGSIDPRNYIGSRIPIIVTGAVLHHNYNIGLWVRSDLSGEFICDNCTLADNALSVRYASHNILKDSLIVGLSKNSNCSRSWDWPENGASSEEMSCKKDVGLSQYYGFIIYDGPSEIDRVHFANFYGRTATPKSLAIMNSFATLKSTAHSARKISFDPNVPISAKVDYYEWPNCAFWSSQLSDEDGSISGVPGSYLIPEIVTKEDNPYFATLPWVPQNLKNVPFVWDKNFTLPPAGDSAVCTKLGTAFTYVCNERMGLIFISAPELYVPPAPMVWINYTRSDGYKMSDARRVFFFHTSVRLNKTSISYGIETFQYLSFFDVRLLEVEPGDFLIFKVENVNSDSKYYLRISNYNHAPLDVSISMDQLNASPFSSVYVDLSLKSAWIKLVSGLYEYNAAFDLYRSKFKYNGVAEFRFVR
jgi:hypothetical protein